MWRKLPDFQAEKAAQNPVTSVAVMAFLVSSKRLPEKDTLKRDACLYGLFLDILGIPR